MAGDLAGRLRQSLQGGGKKPFTLEDELRQVAPGNTVVVFDPKNLRSRFAAFDPDKADSSDLLASYAAPLPTASDDKKPDERKRLAQALIRSRKQDRIR